MHLWSWPPFFNTFILLIIDLYNTYYMFVDLVFIFRYVAKKLTSKGPST